MTYHKNIFSPNTKQWVFQSVVLTGTTLLFLLKPGISKGNEEIKAEIQKVLKQYPAKEWKVQEAGKIDDKTYKIDRINDTIQDPYDQIKGYVDAVDLDYFNKIRTFEATKDSANQLKDKAVVYAVLQDKDLTPNQKKVMALALFEKLGKMPGTEWRFTKKNSVLAVNDPKYTEKYQRYSAYKSYLEGLALDEDIKKGNEKIKQLNRELSLWQGLLDTYKNYNR